jgi:hypothetical protein
MIGYGLRYERGVLRSLPRIIGNTRLVESIQRGTISVGATEAQANASITAVDTTRSILLPGGKVAALGVSALVYNMPRLSLATSSIVRANMNTVTGTNSRQPYQVVQFYPGVIKNVIRNTFTIPQNQASGTANLSPTVDPDKTVVTYLGHTDTNDNAFSSLGDPRFTWVELVLTNSSTLTGSRAASYTSFSASYTYTTTVSYEVVEFY